MFSNPPLAGSASPAIDPFGGASTCPRCGAPHAPDFRFCPRCGAPVEVPAAPASGTRGSAGPAAARPSTWLFVALVGLVALAFLIGGPAMFGPLVGPGPTCAVGGTGGRLSVTVSGPTATDQCAAIVALESAGAWRDVDPAAVAGDPLVCRTVRGGNQIVARGEPPSTLTGDAWCADLVTRLDAAARPAGP